MEADIAPTDAEAMKARVEAALQAFIDADLFEKPKALAELVKALQDLAKLTGLDMDDFTTDGELDFDKIREVLRNLDDLDFGVFGDDLEGQLNAMRFLFAQLGDAAGDMNAKMEKFLEVLEEFSPAAATQLRKAMKQSPEAAKKLLDEWAKILAGGGQPLEDLLSILGISAADLKRLIETGSGLLAGDAAGAVSRSAQIARTITEVQAVEVIAWLEDIAYTLRAIRAILQGQDPVQAIANAGASVPSGSTATGAAGDPSVIVGAAAKVVNIYNTLTIGSLSIASPYLTPDQLEQVMEDFAERFNRVRGSSGSGFLD